MSWVMLMCSIWPGQLESGVQTDMAKMWITSGTQADWMCLLANTSDDAPHKNKSLICLPMKTKGVAGNSVDRISYIHERGFYTQRVIM